MRLISVHKLRVFWEKHPDSERPIRQWVGVVKAYNWKNVNEIKSTLPYVSILKKDRVVFNIKGNDYRIVASFNFSAGICFLCFIGTHKEYGDIDANTVQIN
jgi:mRNA interferase HigB